MTRLKNSINSQVVHDFNRASPGEPAAKKMKKVYKVKFADSWTSFPIRRVNDNPHAFYCIPCKKSVSCANMGINDVKENAKGQSIRKMRK